MNSHATLLTTVPNPANANLAEIKWADNQTFTATSGELAGMFIARDQVIPKQLDSLNALAQAVHDQVNTAHNAGYGLNNSHNVNFFAPFTSTNLALELRLDPAMADTNNIAAATAVDSPGDGNQATALANLRTANVLNGTTINQYLNRTIGDLGIEVNTANTRAKDRDFVIKSMESINEATSGVSLDEEAANLVKSQRAFQAAQQLITTMDDMLNRIINGLGTGGR